MAGISAKDVKALRDSTGAGMMDCKKALSEAEGDVEKAMELLRASGLAKAGKRAGRDTSEGAVVFKAARARSSNSVVRPTSLRTRLTSKDWLSGSWTQLQKLAT
ncbi:MAG: hypothetical protein ACKVIW_03405 [bacterium]